VIGWRSHENIQIIDGALNCTFSIFQATNEEFAILFPEPDQDIQYVEALAGLPQQDEIGAALSNIWERPVRKKDAQGIHGTLFCGLERERLPRKARRPSIQQP
jgi:hypothetical protein